jgi:hypothetical protein
MPGCYQDPAAASLEELPAENGTGNRARGAADHDAAEARHIVVAMVRLQGVLDPGPGVRAGEEPDRAAWPTR